MDLGGLVDERIAELSRLEVAVLKSMPPEVSLPVREKRVTLAQYHDVLDNGAHQIVVQAMLERWFGISNIVLVEGFILSPDGSRRPLTEEEKWPFT